MTKHQTGKTLDLTSKYEDQQKRIAENKRHSNIASSYFNQAPSISNLAKGAYHYYMSSPSLGGNSEELVPLMIGVAPTAGLGKAKNALEALQMVKAMKAAKAAKTATKTASIMQFPKSISQSRLTNSGKTNINRILQALPETERLAVTEALLKNENFWKSYGDGIINVTPGRAASTINAIRRKLGFTGSVYKGQVSYPKHLVSGIREIEDATRRTVGFKRTTRLKPE